MSTIQIRFVLVKPIPDIDFGIQAGKGKDYEVIDKKRSKGRDLTLRFDIAVVRKNGQPHFSGSIAQGPPAARFVYVDIGKYAGQSETDHGARMKVPLEEISWIMVAAVQESGFLEARLPGEQTATTHPIDGWKVVKK